MNGKIPQVNLWDDHDVGVFCLMIGSATNKFYRSLMDLAHTSMNSCVVPFSVVLAVLLINTIYSSSITLHLQHLHSQLVRCSPDYCFVIY